MLKKLLVATLCFTSISYLDGKIGRAPSKEECNKGPKHMRVSARYTSPKGIGYRTGYTTIEGFLSTPNVIADSWIPFLDLRGHVFDNGRFAANAGLGLRYLTTSRIWGINSYYDYRNTNHQHYNQYSLGLESLGRVWDFRINGYLPVGWKQSRYYRTQFGSFQGNSMFIRRTRDFALKGANAEAGFHLDRYKYAPLYFAAGPYYLTGVGTSTWGGELRARVDLFNNYVRLEGNTAYDHFFKWTGQGQISVNIPFGKDSRLVRKENNSCSKAMALNSRAIQPVDRNEIIPVGKQNISSIAIDPATGLPYLFVFVDNTSHSAGTFESPYATLLAAESASNENDIIYVFPGDQTTTGMDAGIVLKDGQRLWGSAVPHSLQTSVGAIQIPALSTGSFVNGSIALLPIITNSGDVVTVANNNEISGLYILTSGGNGVAGSTVSNLSVQNSTIQGSGYTILLTDLSGSILVENNALTSSSTAIYIANPNSNANASVINNQILATGGEAFAWSVSQEGTLNFATNRLNAESNAINIAQSSDSILTATFSNNNIIMFQSGLTLTTGGAETALTFNSNFVTGGGGSNTINLTQTAGTLTANMSNNQIFGYGPGVVVSAGGTSADVNLTSNLIAPGSGDSSTVRAIEIDHTAGSLTASIAKNQTISADQSVLINMGGDEAVLSFESNLFTTYYGHGIDIEQTAGSVTASATNNTIFAQDNDGIKYRSLTDASLSSTLAFGQNNIDAYQPIEISQEVGAVTATINNNTLVGNYTGPGVVSSLNVSDGTQIVTLSGNTVSQTNGDGFDLFTYQNGSAQWTLENNNFYGVGGNAVTISTNGTMGVNTAICVTMDNNIAYPIEVSGHGTYVLSNDGNSGTFTLNPPTNNVGNFTQTGVMTGTCP